MQKYNVFDNKNKNIQVGMKLYWNKEKIPNGNLNPQINEKKQKCQTEKRIQFLTTTTTHVHIHMYIFLSVSFKRLN